MIINVQTCYHRFKISNAQIHHNYIAIYKIKNEQI